MRKTILLLCFAALAAAQNQPQSSSKPLPAPEAPQAIIRESVQMVQAPVTVVDRNGDFVPGLTDYDFRVLDNNKPQKIMEDVALHPLSVVLVIQANNDVTAVLPSIKKRSE